MNIAVAWKALGLDRFARMTDEEWAAHDARVKVQLKAEREAEERQDRVSRDKRRRPAMLSGHAPESELDKLLEHGADITMAGCQAMAGFGTDERRIRVLSGNTGVGKSYAALAWLYKHGGERPRWAQSIEFARRGIYGRESDESQRYYSDWWKEATTMVLDDLGTEFLDSKGAAGAAFDELLNYFAHHTKARLLITCNLGEGLVAERYAARFESRLAGHCRWRDVVGPDLRRTT